jgi:hypothetical protein
MAERMGDYLVRTGVMTQSQVEDVLRAQKAGDKRTFGEIATGLGYATKEAIDQFLAHQQ